jgi:hypothetical protein
MEEHRLQRPRRAGGGKKERLGEVQTPKTEMLGLDTKAQLALRFERVTADEKDSTGFAVSSG